MRIWNEHVFDYIDLVDCAPCGDAEFKALHKPPMVLIGGQVSDSIGKVES